MDIEIPATNKQLLIVDKWKKSSIIKMQSIESAGYECEVNPTHVTFTAKSTGMPYMEGHHALPMKCQGRFKSRKIYRTEYVNFCRRTSKQNLDVAIRARKNCFKRR